MEVCMLGYSRKNIPTPPQREYMKNLLEKTVFLIKRMRWKSYFYRHRDSLDNTQIDEHYGLKSRRTPPQIPELRDFENDLDSLIQRTKFKKTFNRFQQFLKNDIKNTNSSKVVYCCRQRNKKYLLNVTREI